MTATPDDIADRLLDAQVAWAIGEVTGERLVEVLTRDVDEFLTIAARHRVEDLVNREAVRTTARAIADIVGGSEVVSDLVPRFAGAIHGLPGALDHPLGELVEREHVEALVAKFLSMHQLHDRALDRLTESPLVGTVASKFVTKIVADFVAQNRERAEKVPGMSSLFSIGSGAVSKVRSVTDKHVDALIGDAAGKGAQYAIRRTNSAIRELVQDAPLQGAAMELWDLHADEPMSDLRKYLTAKDVRELATLVHTLISDAAGSEYVAAVLDACVDVFFDSYGTHDVTTLLTELGVERDDLVEGVLRHVPPVLDALRESGDLDTIIRGRLAPFFASDTVRAVLAGEQPDVNPAGAKAAKPTRKKPAPTKK